MINESDFDIEFPIDIQPIYMIDLLNESTRRPYGLG